MAEPDGLTILNINDYLNYDFVDFTIVSSSNKSYGTVSRVLGSKTTSLLEVSFENKNYLIPINDSFVISLDLKEKKIKVKNIEEISNL
tara:strand:- start:722 stop:985 length:264 start_codon:yes stop_codon:yes gene_type:complete